MSSDTLPPESIDGDDLRLVHREIARLRSTVAEIRAVQRSLTLMDEHDYRRRLPSQDWLKLDRFWGSALPDRREPKAMEVLVRRLLYWETATGHVLAMSPDAAAIALALISTSDPDPRVLVAGSAATSAQTVLGSILGELGLAATSAISESGSDVEDSAWSVICVVGDDPLSTCRSLSSTTRLEDRGVLLVASSDFEYNRKYRSEVVDLGKASGLALAGHWRSVLLLS